MGSRDALIERCCEVQAVPRRDLSSPVNRACNAMLTSRWAVVSLRAGPSMRVPHRDVALQQSTADGVGGDAKAVGDGGQGVTVRVGDDSLVDLFSGQAAPLGRAMSLDDDADSAALDSVGDRQFALQDTCTVALNQLLLLFRRQSNLLLLGGGPRPRVLGALDEWGGRTLKHAAPGRTWVGQFDS